jgi:hypothetical protein
VSPVALTTSPQVEDVDRIAAMANPVIRNLEITECYAELTAAMRARTGGAADWCTFATWASRQAGRTIRGEDLLDRVDGILGRRSWLLAPLAAVSRLLLRKGLFQPETTLGRIVAAIHTPFDAFERASAAVAAGNLAVFAEIGREFARFLATVPADAAESSPEFLTFVAQLRSGAPPGGQDYLREAFAHYQRQRREVDPSAGAAWVLLGNVKIGLHEQMRLQPQIAAAVDSPLTTAVDLGERVLHAWLPVRRWPALINRAAVPIARACAARLRREAIAVTQQAITESMMVLSLPTIVLSLGRNLIAPVPAILAVAPAFLAAFVRDYDPCPAGGTACAATDWCDLAQRMHYIVHLFRAYAEDSTLFSRPFTPGQVAAFRAGLLPGGAL